MKILINTIISLNYGNRLQNYALQEILKNYGFVFTLKRDNYFIQRKKTNFFKNLLNKIKKCVKPILLHKKYLRECAFKKFNKYINFEINFDNKNLKDLNEDYDYLVCGSDQVWNSSFLNLDSYLMPDIDKNKKIAYAASVGKEKLTKTDKISFEKYLNGFKAISVREKKAKEILQPLTYQRITTLLDPTFLLSKEDWEKVEEKPKFMINKKYIFVYMLGNRSKKYISAINKISKIYNLDIIDIMDKKSKFYSIGPSEFLYLIRNSELVVTDSFHAIVFSIINEKSFIHFKREGELRSISNRIDNLENLFKTKFPKYETVDIKNRVDLFNFKIKDLDKILKNEKEKSKEYLNYAFQSIKKENNLHDYNFNCAGCGLCSSICPVSAISYNLNEEGFIKPVIDDEKCIHCGLCVKNCIQLHSYEKQNLPIGIISANNKNPIKDNSSSAGVFGAIATKILKIGGIVYGVEYNSTKLSFVRIDNLNELNRIKGSKYLQADITGAYSKIETDLIDNKTVLVCGTPCQIAGLKQRFSKFNNLILIRVLCHGVPSQKLANQYFKEEYNEIPKNINFRKTTGELEEYSFEYQFKKGMIDDLNFKKIFLSNIALNDCCYECNFAGKQIGADLTIGDAWGIKNINAKIYSPSGVSLIIPNTKVGVELFESIKDQFNYFIIPKEKYQFLDSNVLHQNNMSKCLLKKQQFYKYLNSLTVDESRKKIEMKNNSFFKKAKRKIKKILRIKR